MAKEKLTAEQVKEFKVEESEAEDAWDYRSLAEDIGEAGDMNWAMQLFKKAEELSKESMDYYMLVEAVAYKDFEARNDENIDKDWMRKLLKNAEELAGEEDDLKRILECVEDIIKDKEWELSIKKKISDFEKQIVLDDDVSESNIVFEPGTGPFKIFYERYSAYTNRNEIRKAKIETVESESVETLLQAIENQKFLIMREDDVIDFSLSENLEDTGFDIIYIKDANGSIIYPNDDVIPKPRSEKNSTVVANFQLRHTKNLNDLKYELWDKLQLVERIFFAPVTQVEFLAGWDIDSFETKGTNAIASFMCGKSSLDNIENLIAEKIKDEINSEWDTLQEMIDEGGFCINYFIDAQKFDEGYDYLHKLMPKFLELVKDDTPSINILHIASGETLSLDGAPDIMGTLMDKFIQYIE